jgi:hypothetical protein
MKQHGILPRPHRQTTASWEGIRDIFRIWTGTSGRSLGTLNGKSRTEIPHETDLESHLHSAEYQNIAACGASTAHRIIFDRIHAEWPLPFDSGLPKPSTHSWPYYNPISPSQPDVDFGRSRRLS